MIRNIIFDLGGILIDLDFDKTHAKFAELGFTEMNQIFGLGKAASFVKEYELGNINDEEFLQSVRSVTNIEGEDDEIIAAWNALLLDFPEERINFLLELKKTHRIFLFSNTNAFHLVHFGNIFKNKYGYALEDLFEKAYYSHIMHLRKPDVESYQYILNDADLNPAETLFIDDAKNNIEGAQKAGLATEHVPKGKTILDIDWKYYLG